ncbi:3-dehydroquinate synthase [Flavipsychrobacter stenotrophus]|uniref:3-dehydroquinate synthase n=1 Tax=Flavipsychrobacter stenotrophus TaxID=2077091 RepID=A0A2S7T2E2_9BACT|nr:3-dehydroquinate synthase [Flavipsychrobacter stenotrophus]PQJ12926.1 3-dehydroquinate synthase [Flavipsychrobacter stenotrophus]
MEQIVTFPSGQVKYLYDHAFSDIWNLYPDRDLVLLTDSNVFELHSALFANRKTIVLNAGEESKSLTVVASVISQLLAMEATRSTILIGVGGGVITDITGFVASIYMRGITFGFVPTTILGMTDAAIGGKNGVNIDEVFKNIAGTIQQPAFILYDTSLLQTLPLKEWSNGFAEVIKYACLFDAPLFEELQQHDLNYYMTDSKALSSLIIRCAGWKNKVVAADEHEKGDRKLLNFGHTAAHAIENLYHIHHGEAVAIGMVIAATLSEQVTGLDPKTTGTLKEMLTRYGLPTEMAIDAPEAMKLLKMDKKRKQNTIDYILLKAPGTAVIMPLPFDLIEKVITQCSQ